MLFHRLKVQGLLSFGPTGIDLPMGPLNVLIGPNASGKSNLLDVFSVLKAAPRDLGEPFIADGIVEWLWKGPDAKHSLTIEATVEDAVDGVLQHSLTLSGRHGRPTVKSEQIEPLGPVNKKALSYRRSAEDEWIVGAKGSPIFDLREPRGFFSLAKHPQENAILFAEHYHPERSLVSFASPADYPGLWHLKERYERIRLYRNWSFGPTAGLRQPQSAHNRADFPSDAGKNLPLVLSHVQGKNKTQLILALQKLFDGIVDISCPVAGGQVSLFLIERGGREIPATRLSDGTLRYLWLLAILLHPDPPPLIAIEERACEIRNSVSHVQGKNKTQLILALQKLFDGIVDISCPVAGGQVSLFLIERGGREIPATRLSDGTLRYLWLLAILLHPDPPPLMDGLGGRRLRQRDVRELLRDAIEEPELGLHPDLLPTLADLLVDASERTQLVVTTHSDILVDALTENPECIVVCEKHDGQTEMRRLDSNDLEKWLTDYRLGELWTSGELGGNRW